MANSVNFIKASFADKQQTAFLDKKFVKTAFILSACALCAFSTMSFLIGGAIGFTAGLLLDLPTKPTVTVQHAAIAMVGATAALLRFTPAGLLGGSLFDAVALGGSFSVGATAYRFFKNQI